MFAFLKANIGRRRRLQAMQPARRADSVAGVRLTAYVRAGSASGSYVVTFALNGGNTVQVYITVE